MTGTLKLQVFDSFTGDHFTYFIPGVYACDEISDPILSTTHLCSFGIKVTLGNGEDMIIFPVKHVCSFLTQLNVPGGSRVFFEERQTTPPPIRKNLFLELEF